MEPRVGTLADLTASIFSAICWVTCVSNNLGQFVNNFLIDAPGIMDNKAWGNYHEVLISIFNLKTKGIN